jgi:hypothetical protein
MWSHTSSLAGLVETLVRQGADVDAADAVHARVHACIERRGNGGCGGCRQP